MAFREVMAVRGDRGGGLLMADRGGSGGHGSNGKAGKLGAVWRDM